MMYAGRYIVLETAVVSRGNMYIQRGVFPMCNLLVTALHPASTIPQFCIVGLAEIPTGVILCCSRIRQWQLLCLCARNSTTTVMYSALCGLELS